MDGGQCDKVKVKVVSRSDHQTLSVDTKPLQPIIVVVGVIYLSEHRHYQTKRSEAQKDR